MSRLPQKAEVADGPTRAGRPVENEPHAATKLHDLHTQPMGALVARTMEEASSAQDGESLSPDDFNKVVAPTDFASKLVIVL